MDLNFELQIDTSEARKYADGIKHRLENGEITQDELDSEVEIAKSKIKIEVLKKVE
jgi:hypothetical protein